MSGATVGQAKVWLFLQGNNKVIAGSAACALLLSVTGLADAKTVFTQIDVPGAVDTRASAINDSGTAAGYYLDQNNHWLGFVRHKAGTLETFDPKHATQVYVYAINSAGMVVGGYNAGGGGFIRAADGTITDVSCPADGYGAVPTSINDDGVVAGSCLNSSDNTDLRGFVRTADGTALMFSAATDAVRTYVWGIDSKGDVSGDYDYYDNSVLKNLGFIRTANGKITTFDVPKGTGTIIVRCMNESGAVAGSYQDKKSRSHPYLRSADGTITEYDTPKEWFGPGCAMNADGSVVSSYNTSTPEGYLRAPSGTITTLPIADSKETIPTGINAKNVIAGWFADDVSPYHTHGFLLKGLP
jgi:hypothetical protein